MNDEKVKLCNRYDKRYGLRNKLRLAICMCDNYSHTNLEYDRKRNV